MEGESKTGAGGYREGGKMDVWLDPAFDGRFLAGILGVDTSDSRGYLLAWPGDGRRTCLETVMSDCWVDAV